MGKVRLTQLPYLNSVVLRQEKGTRFFVAAPDSFIIDKAGLLKFIEELVRIRFINSVDLTECYTRAYLDEDKDEINENKKDSGNSS